MIKKEKKMKKEKLKFLFSTILILIFFISFIYKKDDEIKNFKDYRDNSSLIKEDSFSVDEFLEVKNNELLPSEFIKDDEISDYNVSDDEGERVSELDVKVSKTRENLTFQTLSNGSYSVKEFTNYIVGAPKTKIIKDGFSSMGNDEKRDYIYNLEYITGTLKEGSDRLPSFGSTINNFEDNWSYFQKDYYSINGTEQNKTNNTYYFWSITKILEEDGKFSISFTDLNGVWKTFEIGQSYGDFSVKNQTKPEDYEGVVGETNDNGLKVKGKANLTFSHHTDQTFKLFGLAKDNQDFEKKSIIYLKSEGNELNKGKKLYIFKDKFSLSNLVVTPNKGTKKYSFDFEINIGWEYFEKDIQKINLKLFFEFDCITTTTNGDLGYSFLQEIVVPEVIIKVPEVETSTSLGKVNDNDTSFNLPNQEILTIFEISKGYENFLQETEITFYIKGYEKNGSSFEQIGSSVEQKKTIKYPHNDKYEFNFYVGEILNQTEWSENKKVYFEISYSYSRNVYENGNYEYEKVYSSFDSNSNEYSKFNKESFYINLPEIKPPFISEVIESNFEQVYIDGKGTIFDEEAILNSNGEYYFNALKFNFNFITEKITEDTNLVENKFTLQFNFLEVEEQLTIEFDVQRKEWRIVTPDYNKEIWIKNPYFEELKDGNQKNYLELIIARGEDYENYNLDQKYDIEFKINYGYKVSLDKIEYNYKEFKNFWYKDSTPIYIKDKEVKISSISKKGFIFEFSVLDVEDQFLDYLQSGNIPIFVKMKFNKKKEQIFSFSNKKLSLMEYEVLKDSNEIKIKIKVSGLRQGYSYSNFSISTLSSSDGFVDVETIGVKNGVIKLKGLKDYAISALVISALVILGIIVIVVFSIIVYLGLKRLKKINHTLNNWK